MHVSSIIKNKSTVSFPNIMISCIIFYIFFISQNRYVDVASNYFVHKHWLVEFDSKFSTELNQVYSSVKQIQTISILQLIFNSTTHFNYTFKIWHRNRKIDKTKKLVDCVPSKWGIICPFSVLK